MLLKNENNLTEKQADSLIELLDANLPLSIAYLLKEEIRRARSVWKPFRRWKSWFRKVKESDIQPLRSFARKLKLYFRGIISNARHPLRTSCLEGINKKITVIKRMAYGYRDNDYFFLKIKVTFPGKT